MENIYNNNFIDIVSKELNKLEFIKESIVLYKKDVDEQDCLIAYVRPKNEITEDFIDELKCTLKPQLKSHKLYITQVVSIPKNIHNKVDLELLQSIPILDTELFPLWKTKLSKALKVKNLEIVKYDNKPPLNSYHMQEIKSYIGDVRDSHYRVDPPNLTTGNSYVSIEGRDKAVVDGEHLLIPEDSPSTMIQAFLNTVKNYPNYGLIYLKQDQSSEFISYPQLLEDASRLLTFLKMHKCKPKDIMIITLSDLREHLTTFWACVLGGLIPITIAVPPVFNKENSVVRKLSNIWEFLGKPQIICNNSITQEIHNLLDEKGKVVTLPKDYHSFALCETFYAAGPDDVLFLQATSGSTGDSKCVQITNKGVISYIHATKPGYTNHSVSLNWLPHDHVAPVLTYHLKDLYLGINQIKVSTEEVLSKPLTWLLYMDKYKVTHSWAPNFAFKLIYEQFQKSPIPPLDLSSLVCLMNAGEQVVFEVTKNFSEILKPYGLNDGAVQPAYGMAETCTAITYCSDFVSANLDNVAPKICILENHNIAITNSEDSRGFTRFVDLGNPIPGVSIRIVNDNRLVLNERTVGNVEVKGDVVTPGYFQNMEANNESFTEDGWFRTGDLGFINNKRLTIIGRKKETIVIRGANFFCSEIEEIVSNIHGVKSTYCAAFGVSDLQHNTEELVIFFVPLFDLEDNFNLIKNIKEHVATKIGINASYILPIPAEQFPKTTSGKIQRGELKNRFIKGEYNDLKYRIDKFLDNENTMPIWFYKRVWCDPIKLDTLDPQVKEDHRVVIIFVRKDELNFYRNNLALYANYTVTVALGNKFRVISNQEFEIDVEDLCSYRILFKTLQKENIIATHILHFGSCEVDNIENLNIQNIKNTHNLSVLSVLRIIVGINDVKYLEANRKLSFLIFSCNAQSVFGNDLTNLIHSGLPAIVEVINSEFTNINSRHIDFLQQDLHTHFPDYLKQELYNSNKNIEPEVAYRNGVRYIPKLQHLNQLLNHSYHNNIRKKGLYIITGGFGGLGMQVCQYLYSKYQAELIILGRTPKEMFSPEQNISYKLLSDTVKVLSYYAVDICDFQKLQEVVEIETNGKNKKIDGIFHIAGVYNDNLLIDETVENLENTFHPKVYGSWNLYKIIKEYNPEGLFVAFSSLVSQFGSATLGSYAMANRFLENLAVYQKHFSSIRAYALLWSNWTNLGMSRGYRENFAKGFYGISCARGLASLDLSLQGEPSSVIIGLNGNNKNIINRVLSSTYPLKALNVHLKPDDNKTFYKSYTLKDPFGVNVPYNIILNVSDDSSKNPKSPEAVIDENSDDYPMQQQLIEIWYSLLGIENIGLENNFFDLGGNSLLLIQLRSNIETKFLVPVKVTELIKCPTINAQVGLIVKKINNS